MAAAMPYGVYNEFAWCYRRGWGEDYHRSARPALESFVLVRLRPGARILDLCCGSGDLSAMLAEREYQVTGIDGSVEMLRFARERVPAAEFLCADARAFELYGFDAVLSTFDSLNHVLSACELESVFRNVHRALVPGGLFTFDLNMQEAYETLWNGQTAAVEDAHVSITRGSYDRETRTGRAEVTLFRREDNGLWRRFDITVLERCYSSEEVSGALARAGFVDIGEREAYELGMRGDVALGRSFFFANRP